MYRNFRLGLDMQSSFFICERISVPANPFIFSRPMRLLLCRFVESSDPLWKGYFYTVLIIIATVATTVINNQYAFKQWMIGLQV